MRRSNLKILWLPVAVLFTALAIEDAYGPISGQVQVRHWLRGAQTPTPPEDVVVVPPVDPPPVGDKCLDGTAEGFVDGNVGNNSNAGTKTLPWRDIGRGAAATTAGETLCVRGGVYTGSNNAVDTELGLWAVNSGNATNRVYIRAYPGETVIIRPPDQQQAFRFGVGAAHHITVTGFIIDGINGTVPGHFGGADLIYIRGGSNNIRFEGNEIANSSASGVSISTSEGVPFNIEISGNIIRDNGRASAGGDLSNAGYACYCNGNDTTFEDNEVYGNNGYGWHQNTEPTSGGGNRNIIRRNYFHDNRIHGDQSTGGGTSFAVAFDEGEDNLVYNNLIVNNAGGIMAYVNTRRLGIYNNTIVNSTAHECVFMQYYSNTWPPTARNNLCWNNAGGSINDYGQDETLGGNGVCSHNLAVSPGGILCANNQTANPNFINPAALDYRTQAGSVARNTGTTIATVLTDFLLIMRPQNGAYDIGAYEQ